MSYCWFSYVIFLLKHGTFSQFEDSNLLIWGKSSLNHTFTYFFCTIILVFFFVNSNYVYVDSLLIFHYYHFSLIPFILLLPFYFAFSFIASVSWPVFSRIYSYSFLCCTQFCLHFMWFLNFLFFPGSAASISSSDVLQCAWTYFIKAIIFGPYFIKAIASFFYSWENNHNLSYASWQ